MILTISTTHKPATDLGYLLHKHPDNVQEFNITGGKATVFYPEANEDRCTMALFMELDPIALVRKMGGSNPSLSHYVNDRPYATSSFTSSTLSGVFGTALAGNCKTHPELVNQPLPLEVRLPTLTAKGGEGIIRRMFEPLGYTLAVETLPLDEQHPSWGDSALHDVTLQHTLPLQRLLEHLYVLLPAMDVSRHFYVSKADVDVLLQKGEHWLKDHPDKNLITQLYFLRIKGLANLALESLTEESEPTDAPELPPPIQSLHQLRLDMVLQTLLDLGVNRVVDLGCGEGKLLQRLLQHGQFQDILGMDVSHRVLQKARRTLNLETAGPAVLDRIRLIHGSLTYYDARWAVFEAATLVEVIEHLDAERLQTLERIVFGHAKPKHVVLTTPNREFNVNYEFLPPGALRHQDHRFEWTREEFSAWCTRISQTYGYTATLSELGQSEPDTGAPSQMVVFSKIDDHQQLAGAVEKI